MGPETKNKHKTQMGKTKNMFFSPVALFGSRNSSQHWLSVRSTELRHPHRRRLRASTRCRVPREFAAAHPSASMLRHPAGNSRETSQRHHQHQPADFPEMDCRLVGVGGAVGLCPCYSQRRAVRHQGLVHQHSHRQGGLRVHQGQRRRLRLFKTS